MPDDVSIYITTNLRTEEHRRMLVTAIEYANKHYPTERIVIIDDNSSLSVSKDELSRIHSNLEIIRSEYPGAGELLRLYYYLHDKNPTKWAICVHDSQFINTRFSLPSCPYRFLYTAKHVHDNPLRELSLVAMIGSKELTKFFRRERKSWKTAFGAQCIVKHEFLQKINVKLPRFFTTMIPNVKSRSDRMCCERIVGVVFQFTQKCPVKAMYGDIFDYAAKQSPKGWGYQYLEFIRDTQHSGTNLETIKVWVGR